MINQPPEWANRFLRWFCKPQFLEEIEGDLFEIYQMKTRNKSLRYARRTYLLDVLKFFRWSNLKHSKLMKSRINYGLWGHNFKIALRVFKRNLLFSSLNISGLILGITAFIFLIIYYSNEKQVDKHFPANDRIYRITENDYIGDNFKESAQTPVPFKLLLEDRVPQIEELSRFTLYPGLVFSNPDSKATENQFVFTDANVFKVFPFKLTKGSYENCLNAPNQVIISEEKALQYFGSEDPIGKTITYLNEYAKKGDEMQFKVVGVAESFSHNSHLNIDFLASHSSLDNTILAEYGWGFPITYLYAKLYNKLGSNELEAVKQRTQQVFEEVSPPHFEDRRTQLQFQALTDIHLHSNLLNEWKSNNTMVNIDIFLALAFFILLIAVINYVNLTTAESQQRSKEIGLKKAMGSAKMQLIRQFFMESILMVVLSTVIAIGVVMLLWKPITGRLMQLDLAFRSILSLQNTLIAIGFIFILSAIAGLYPTLTTIRFNPIDVLKNNLNGYMGKGNQRRVLVAIQFSISMCLILGTLLLIKQYDYLQNKNLGYDVEFRAILRMSDEATQIKHKALKEKLLQQSFIEQVSISSGEMSSEDAVYTFDFTYQLDHTKQQSGLFTLETDNDFIKTFGMKITHGRDFNKSDLKEGSISFLLNEQAAKSFGWGMEAVGKELEMSYYGEVTPRKGRVVGIIEDFHFQSLYQTVKPIVIHSYQSYYGANYMNITLKHTESIVAQIRKLEELYKEFNDYAPMEISFIEEKNEQMYNRELTSSRIIAIFTILSIIIAALGVFGLANFTVRRRIKEIGVRKILGASAKQIIALVSKEYLYLIVISCIVSWPLVYFFASDWLSNFPYATDFGAGNYLIGLALLIIVTMFSSIKQILESINSNPVEHLRQE